MAGAWRALGEALGPYKWEPAGTYHTGGGVAARQVAVGTGGHSLKCPSRDRLETFS
jgi:hypothetical protein